MTEPLPVDGVSVDGVPEDERTATDTLLDLVTTLVAGTKRDIAEGHALEVLETLVRHATELIVGADYASVTLVRRSGRPATVASSHDEALRADRIQYRLGEGPCLSAAVNDATYVTGDLPHDDRWVDYGREVHRELGITSVAAYQLTLLGEENADAALNIYSRAPEAFDDDDVARGLVLATQCSLLISAHLANDRAENLLLALGSNREIGVAVGVIITRLHVTQDQAFALLRMASQDSNRKLVDIAREVADTGEVPRRRPRESPTRRA